jgi:anti-sigma-K factor RskA
MSTSPDHPEPMQEPPGDDVIAGEYVLGVLDADTHRAFATRLPREPALAREVSEWERQLAPMLEEVEPVTPPPGLWPRVRQHVGLATVQAASRAAPLWERLGFWRGFGAAGLAATAASLVALLVLRQPYPQYPHAPHPITMLTTIAQANGSPAFVAAVDADACTMLLMPMDANVPKGKVPELWVIAGDGVPRSLGVRGMVHADAIVVPKALRNALLAAATLAVSIEPVGGSPTGAPTGEVIAKGALAKLTL